MKTALDKDDIIPLKRRQKNAKNTKSHEKSNRRIQHDTRKR